MSERRVQRFDVGVLDKFEKLPGGGIRVPAFLARTGIQVYRTEDGREIRELRHPDDVFAEPSYRSFEHTPVTDLHPAGLVDATNRRELARGHVCNVRPDGNRLAADLLVTDAEMIRLIEAGERVETSGGYTCVVEEKGGIYDGQPYDTRQREIRGNHAGLGPEGWGRAGSEVGLRLDGKGHQLAPGRAVARLDGGKNEETMTTARKIKVDGVDCEAGSDTHLSLVDRLIAKKDGEIAELRTKLDAAGADARKQIDEMKGRLDGATAKTTKLEADLAEATKRADAAVAPAAVDARVAERVDLVTRARRVLGAKFDAKGKTDAEVMRAVLEHRGVKLEKDASDAYVRGRFDTMTDEPPKKKDEDALEGEDEEGEETATDSSSARRDGVRMKPGEQRADGGEPKTVLDQVEEKNREWASKANERFAIRKRS